MTDIPTKTVRSMSWTVYALIVAVPGVAGILIWQLQKLEPSKWCGAAIGTAKITDSSLDAAKACFSLMAIMLDIYKRNTLALIAVLGLSIVILVVSTLRMRVAVSAPGGMGAVIGDDGIDVSGRLPTTTTTTTTTAPTPVPPVPPAKPATAVTPPEEPQWRR